MTQRKGLAMRDDSGGLRAFRDAAAADFPNPSIPATATLRPSRSAVGIALTS
jgi:hypothetical protein